MTTYYRRFLTFAFFALLTLPSFAEEVNFINDNVRTAIDRAAAEGKLVFLDFWADYCSPCKLMEKYTFTDPSVIQRMNGSYVPVRINIETFDGYDLKAQYNVKLLPTIIVLNSKGKQVARFEESMSASKLNEILAKYDTKKNRKKFAKPAPESEKSGYSQDFDIVAKPNVSSTSFPTANVLVTAPVVAAPTSVNTRVSPPSNTGNSMDKTAFRAPPTFGIAPVKPTATPTDVPRDYNRVTANRSVTKVERPANFNAPNTTNTYPNKVAKVNNTVTTTAKNASLTSITAGYFTIQVGNFSKKDNADRVSKIMKTQMAGKQKVFLLSGGSESSVTHRVMVGGFKTHKEATDFKIKNQIDGFIQNYGSYIR